MKDPTLTAIQELDDPFKYRKVEGVPVCFPHRRVFSNKSVLEVKESDLSKIASDANEPEKSGRLQPFTLGHRKHGDVKETDQPPLLGFYRNYRVEEVIRNGKPIKAVVADEYCAIDRMEKHDVYRQFPYRSMEITPSRQIVGVAALLQPPALDMGTVYVYSSHDYAAGKPRIYTMEPLAMNDDAMPTVDDNDPEFQKFMQYFAAAMKKYGGAMGATNASMPTPASQTQNYSAANAVEPRVIELEARIQALQNENKQVSCRRLLDPIRDYCRFDYDRELSMLMKYQTADEQAGHVNYILEHYEKLPTGPMIPIAYSAKPQGMVNARAEIDPMQITVEQHTKIKAYAAEHNVSYAEATVAVIK